MGSDNWPQLATRTVCVVPVYNECGVLKSVLEELRELFPNVLCVDDGSTDGSHEIADSLGVRTIRHVVNIGQGGALQTGFAVVMAERRFDYLVTIDADGQHDPRDAVRMVRLMDEQRLDVVLASRFLGGSARTVPIHKRIILKFVVLLTRLTSRSELTDTHNGLRAIRCEVLESTQIRQFGMAHATELVSMLIQSDFRISEIPVEIRYTRYSRKKGQSILNSVNILLDLLWR